MKTVALQGYTFSRNFGDILLQHLFADWLRQVGVEKIVVPVAPDPVYQELKADARGVEQLKQADGLLFFGGGYFGAPSADDPEWNKRQVDRYGAVISEAARLSLPQAVMGVGVGPLPPGPFVDQMRHLFGAADPLLVRDEFSAASARSVGGSHVRIVRDAAFSLPAIIPPVERGSNVLLHMTGAYADRRYVEGIVKGIKGTPFDGEVSLTRDDKKIANPLLDIARRIAGRTVDKDWTNLKAAADALALRVSHTAYENVPQFVRAIAGARFVVTSKLHVGLVALAYGTPMIALANHQKVANMFIDFGLSSRIIGPGDFSEDKVKQVVSEQINNPHRLDLNSASEIANAYAEALKAFTSRRSN